MRRVSRKRVARNYLGRAQQEDMKMDAKTQKRIETAYNRHLAAHKAGKCLKDCMVCQKTRVVNAQAKRQ